MEGYEVEYEAGIRDGIQGRDTMQGTRRETL